MSYLPISINLENKKVLIVGGGNVALTKLSTIQKFCTDIRVVAPEMKTEFESGFTAELIVGTYKKEHLQGAFMVFACTGDPAVNEQVLADAEELGVLCNRTDKAEESHFHSAALVESDNFILGINTKNKDRKQLVALKRELQHYIDERDRLSAEKEKQKGKVYLVGFGPGNPDLLTRRGEQLLTQADEIFYDDLLDAEALANYAGTKTYVGKRRDNHSKEQSEINEILYRSAQKGNMVVRLKGGDPLIFGRGSEERFYLEERGVQVEIVPGISSAVAAAAYGNIPLTHRGIASSVAFGTAHAKNSYKILESDTSVYYMGAKNIIEIAQKYLDSGYPGSYPVGLVHNVSMPGQSVTRTTISQLAAGAVEVKSPVISIFGNTVNYAELMKDEEQNSQSGK